MIYDNIRNLRAYSAVIPHAQEIADYIEKTDFEAMERKGGFPVCEGVTMNLAEYAPGEGSDYEAHRQYHDLQLAVRGCERIDIIPTDKAINSKGYKPDAEFFSAGDCSVTSAALDEGMFAFLAPQDAHKPCIKSTTDTILKAVFKIRVD